MSPTEQLDSSAAPQYITLGAQNPQSQSGKLTRFYRPELDLLRFLAFMSVFFCHALPFDDLEHPRTGHLWQWLQMTREAGNFGVCLFFFLSSYLITELLRREHLQTRTVDLKAFYIRRSLRIWPLYFTVLLGIAFLGAFISDLHLSIPQFFSYLLFVSNWYTIFTVGLHNPLSWLWSISVEEQFYIVWPTMAKFGGMRSVAAGSILCLPLSVLTIGLVEKYQQHPAINVWLNSIAQFQFFAWGALLAVFLSGRVPNLSTVARITLTAAGCVSWLFASGICKLKQSGADPGMMRITLGYELVALGCIFFFLAALGTSVSKFPKFALYLGKISYGLYIFHEFALMVTTALRHLLEQGKSLRGLVPSVLFTADRACSLVLTIAVAALSYKFIEVPFLELKNRFTLVRSRPV